MGSAPDGTSPSEIMEDITLNGAANGGNSSSDDEVVVGEDEEFSAIKDSLHGTSSSSNTDTMNGSDSMNPESEKEIASPSNDLGFFRFDAQESEDLFGDRPMPEWVGWGDSPDLQVGGSGVNPFVDSDIPDADASTPDDDSASPPPPPANDSSSSSTEPALPNGSATETTSPSEGSPGGDVAQKSVAVPSLFEEDVEFVGVELEGTEKAMDQALKEGIVGEAGPLKRDANQMKQEKENSDDGGAGVKEFNDANYWRVDQEVAVLE